MALTSQPQRTTLSSSIHLLMIKQHELYCTGQGVSQEYLYFWTEITLDENT